MSIIKIPGTDFVGIAEDTNLTKKAEERGTILIEDELRDFVRGKVGKGDVVLDIGAYVGDTALIFKSMTQYVLAFEPQPDAFKCLQINSPTSINFCVAVGDGSNVVCGEETLDNNGNLGTRQVLLSDGHPSLRIDSLGLGKVDFVKIDVEGFEMRVLHGMEQTVQRFSPRMLIEVFPDMMERYGDTEEKLFTWLDNMGYKHVEAIGNSKEPRWDIYCEL